MAKFGLKIWSENLFYIEPAKKLFDEGVYDYIEIYSLPETSADTIMRWKSIGVEFVVHAPHFMHGLNFSDSDKFSSNISIAESAIKFADMLQAEKIIFHPGIKGDYRETARQMSTLKDKRILVENKPYKIAKTFGTLKADDVCVGYSPEEIGFILENTGHGFCLDIGHGICAANGLGIDSHVFIVAFMELSPKMFHLSDGDKFGAIDKHYNIGKGSYNFDEIFSIMPSDPIISIETEKSSKTNLDDFKDDVAKLRCFATK